MTLGLFDALHISGSGLSAERLRLDVISDNIANANATRSADGSVYRRKVALLAPRSPERAFGGFLGFLNYFRAKDPQGGRPLAASRDGINQNINTPGNAVGLGYSGKKAGVRVVGVIEDASPLKRRYEPGHPDAGEDGYVDLPNVDVIKEMVEMISATRAYEANVTMINSFKHMASRALDIGRG